MLLLWISIHIKDEFVEIGKIKIKKLKYNKGWLESN